MKKQTKKTIAAAGCLVACFSGKVSWDLVCLKSRVQICYAPSNTPVESVEELKKCFRQQRRVMESLDRKKRKASAKPCLPANSSINKQVEALKSVVLAPVESAKKEIKAKLPKKKQAALPTPSITPNIHCVFKESSTVRGREKGRPFFCAYVRNAQTIVSGKALSFVLREAIPVKGLPSGAIVRGVPRISGDRIAIQVTSYKKGNSIRPIQLDVFDKNDLLPGLFHERLAQNLEKEVEDEALDTALGVQFRGVNLIRKGAKVVKKQRKITLPSGMEVFLSPPLPKPKKRV